MNRWERLVEPGPWSRWVARHERGIFATSVVIGMSFFVFFGVAIITSGFEWLSLLSMVSASLFPVWGFATPRMLSRYVAAWEKQEAEDAARREMQ